MIIMKGIVQEDNWLLKMLLNKHFKSLDKKHSYTIESLIIRKGMLPHDFLLTMVVPEEHWEAFGNVHSFTLSEIDVQYCEMEFYVLTMLEEE
jgi:hypothetical protein